MAGNEITEVRSVALEGRPEKRAGSPLAFGSDDMLISPEQWREQQLQGLTAEERDYVRRHYGI